MEPHRLGLDQNSLARAMIFPRCSAAVAARAAARCNWSRFRRRIRHGFQRKRPPFWRSSSQGGVLVAGDRRATPGNTVVYDRADKVLEIDRHSIMAIAGVPATAWEMARVLEHSFQFFRRTQLQEMSVDGKVRALSKLLRDNFGFVLQGVGIVVPIFATYDSGADPSARLYFYDAMGAQFEVDRLRRHRLGFAGRARDSLLRKQLGEKAAGKTERR